MYTLLIRLQAELVTIDKLYHDDHNTIYNVQKYEEVPRKTYRKPIVLH